MTTSERPATETLIMGWTSPSGDVTIQIVKLHTGIFQLRQKSHGGGRFEVIPYATLAEARIDARMRAELLVITEKGA